MSGYNSGTHPLTGILFGTITADASANQDPTGSVIFNLLGALATFNISSNTNSTVVVNQSVSALDTLNLSTNGGTISVGTGLLGDTVNATISGGGNYIVGTGAASLLLSGTGTLGFNGTGGTLTLGKAGTYAGVSETTAITGFKLNVDKIDDQSLKFSAITSYTVAGSQVGNETVTVHDSSGDFSFVVNNAGLATGTFAVGAGPITLAADSGGGTTIGAICFLRGTRIATPDGETPVESLGAGDLVATRENGETVFQAVTWVGHRSVDVGRLRGSVDAHPVRIRAGAFAKNVPHRDLLVTPEHCVFVDGRLVPARMLVNGGSIIADTSISKYEFFHVELDRHSILIAEGLETESYLDTGNRANFINVAVPNAIPSFSVDAAHAMWATHAAAPLAVDRETVEPIWQRLVERSNSIGFGAGIGAGFSEDPDLCVVTDAGITVRPTARDGRVYSFALPSGSRSMRLMSKTARPADVVGPFLDDRRELGVLVGEIGLDTGRGRTTTVVAERADALAGWYLAEAGAAYRWTNGDAELPLDVSASVPGRPMILDVEVIHAGPYPVKRALARAA